MGDRGRPCYFCTVQNWGCSAFLSLLGCQRWADEPETWHRHPHLGSHPAACLGSRRRLCPAPSCRLGLTRQPHSSPFPAQILVSSKPRDAAVWWGSPASPPGGCGTPLTPKALQAEQPQCPGAGLPIEALPTPHLPGSPGSCCCLPQPTKGCTQGLAQRK